MKKNEVEKFEEVYLIIDKQVHALKHTITRLGRDLSNDVVLDDDVICHFLSCWMGLLIAN